MTFGAILPIVFYIRRLDRRCFVWQPIHFSRPLYEWPSSPSARMQRFAIYGLRHAAFVAPLLNILHVFGVGAETKMARITASMVIASMQDESSALLLLRFGNRTVYELPGNAVSGLELTIY